HTSRVGLGQPGDDAEHRRLAGSARPEQRVELARPDVDRHVAHHPGATRALADARQLHLREADELGPVHGAIPGWIPPARRVTTGISSNPTAASESSTELGGAHASIEVANTGPMN